MADKIGVVNGTAAPALRQSDADHQSLVVDYNHTTAPYPDDTSIVALFASQVARTPDAEAVRLGDTRLTYRELDARANQVAARLAGLGVGAKHVVALSMEHSIEVVCAILGTLKAGAAYAPLDPHVPAARLATILRDIAQASGGALPVLITQSRLAAGVPAGVAQVLTLDADFAALDGCSPDGPAATVSPEDLAYIIFTSGSTGTPKGVMIRHRSLVNYIWWAKDLYGRGEALTWPLFSSLAFDLTVTSIFTPLITGGRVVVYREDPLSRSLVIFDVIRDGLADVVKLTPAHLEMVKDLNLGATRIRCLVVGGEDFKTALAKEITDRFGRDIRIYNEYGPTEATVGCMHHLYDRRTDLAASVPIGRPAANAQIYVLDEQLRPVPTGVIGEMYIGGDGLALGYFNRPDLTSKTFIHAADPRQAGPASQPALSRMYKTADLARWSADGRMEFLGRADRQIKIGGFRIELGEIEACLRQRTDIRDVVVDLNATTDGLVAYYVGDALLPAPELRAHLAAHLPDYMLPSHFVRLDRLPLTSNGKVDRKALAVETTSQRSAAELAPPTTASERMVLGVFCEVLSRADLGVHDNFFEIGGHSLVAARLVSRLNAVSGVDIPLRNLFEEPTAAGLARIVDALSYVAQSKGAGASAGEEIEL